MDIRPRSTLSPHKVLCVVMGGGTGQGLFPLTRDRATPAVPVAGNYRLLDVPISNCINSGFRQIYVLTQFNSASLHRHVSEAYKFDQFSDGFVEIRPAQQTSTDSSWYQGTADAVRKNLPHFLSREFDYALILSADQLYRQDLQAMVAHHARVGADITLGAVPVPRAAASFLGVLQIDRDSRVLRFVEKPRESSVLDSLRLDAASCANLGLGESGDLFLGSMGIYVFSRAVLQALLQKGQPDFGRDIMPDAVQSCRLYSHLHRSYWADIGTIRPFFEAHLDFASELPQFNFFDLTAPIFSKPLYLPGAKVNGARVDHALLAAGCIINYATISQSVIGIRAIVGSGSYLNRVVSLGCDYYESQASIESHQKAGVPRMGIGQNAHIENAIVDKNARIGDNVVITPNGKPAQVDHETYYIRDGIVIIPRNGIVPHGAVI
jgi:glucose-1-phosphate adenylyltransferase